jgi:hypothetical protein
VRVQPSYRIPGRHPYLFQFFPTLKDLPKLTRYVEGHEGQMALMLMKPIN